MDKMKLKDFKAVKYSYSGQKKSYTVKVIIPKEWLADMGIVEGDYIELTYDPEKKEFIGRKNS